MINKEKSVRTSVPEPTIQEPEQSTSNLASDRGCIN